MKTPFLLTIIYLFVGYFGIVLHAEEINDDLALSPDHPLTWVTGADITHQSFVWDEKKKMLYLDVTFSTRYYSDGTHPTEDQSYRLSFPTVHFDPATKLFFVDQPVKEVVGKLKHSFLSGNSMEISKTAQVDVRTHHGEITAKIIPSTY